MSFYIPQEMLESVAEFLLPDIREFANSDLGKKIIENKYKEESKLKSDNKQQKAEPKALP